ncbi:MAG: aspartate aminotransferase family protein, partial [Candidatus Thorarchaeota archaeon]
MQGIELVRNQKTKEPAPKELLQVMELCKTEGLLIGKGGIDGNAIRIQPPLELTRDQIDSAYQILDKAFTEVEKTL